MQNYTVIVWTKGRGANLARYNKVIELIDAGKALVVGKEISKGGNIKLWVEIYNPKDIV
jgi:hypothetical protein